MNESKVEKLFYRVIIPEHTDYDSAPPVSGETDDFKWHLSKDQLLIEMKSHYSSGKRGRAANALRTILTAASAKVRNRVVLEVIE